MKIAVGIVAMYNIGGGEVRPRGTPGGPPVRAGLAVDLKRAETLRGGRVRLGENRDFVPVLGEAL